MSLIPVFSPYSAFAVQMTIGDSGSFYGFPATGGAFEGQLLGRNVIALNYIYNPDGDKPEDFVTRFDVDGANYSSGTEVSLTVGGVTETLTSDGFTFEVVGDVFSLSSKVGSTVSVSAVVL